MSTRIAAELQTGDRIPSGTTLEIMQTGNDVATVLATLQAHREVSRVTDSAFYEECVVVTFRNSPNWRALLNRTQAVPVVGPYVFPATWDEMTPGQRFRVGFQESAQDATFVRIEKKSDDDPIYAGQRFVVYTTTQDGPERKAGLTSYRGQEEAPRPPRES